LADRGHRFKGDLGRIRQGAAQPSRRETECVSSIDRFFANDFKSPGSRLCAYSGMKPSNVIWSAYR
jgi:hypothetical protein